MSAARTGVGLFAAAALMACGPSFQAIYEGNARFEHCYALEENAQTPMPDKAACWRDWSERYTYGQTRDRINYATARYVALSDAHIPTDEALMMAAPGETPRTSTITAPAPTNAFAPPPKVLDPSQHETTTSALGGTASAPLLSGDAGAPLLVAAVTLPATACTDKCAGDFHACSGNGGCDAGPGPGSGSGSGSGSMKKKTCQTCMSTYRACMRECFK